jgi:hypothetical protein
MVIKSHNQTDLVKAITQIASSIPLARRIQLYEFALFLETHPLPIEETLEAVAADEAQWDAQFAATSEESIASLIAAVEADVNAGRTDPMFDKNGEFIERQ